MNLREAINSHQCWKNKFHTYRWNEQKNVLEQWSNDDRCWLICLDGNGLEVADDPETYWTSCNLNAATIQAMRGNRVQIFYDNQWYDIYYNENRKELYYSGDGKKLTYEHTLHFLVHAKYRYNMEPTLVS